LWALASPAGEAENLTRTRRSQAAPCYHDLVIVIVRIAGAPVPSEGRARRVE
jgi:hypothetical protein